MGGGFLEKPWKTLEAPRGLPAGQGALRVRDSADPPSGLRPALHAAPKIRLTLGRCRGCWWPARPPRTRSSGPAAPAWAPGGLRGKGGRVGDSGVERCVVSSDPPCVRRAGGRVRAPGGGRTRGAGGAAAAPAVSGSPRTRALRSSEPGPAAGPSARRAAGSGEVSGRAASRRCSAGWPGRGHGGGAGLNSVRVSCPQRGGRAWSPSRPRWSPPNS